MDATLRRQHEQEKLSSIVSRIESYDAIDCSNDEAEKVISKNAIDFVTIQSIPFIVDSVIVNTRL